MKPPNTDSWLPKENLIEDDLKKSSHHSHAFYRDATEDGIKLHHGRIICRLEAETPFFIGAKGNREQGDEGQSATVANYRLNGAIAVPATSLRGMISSLAEAASNSAMRVLGDGVLSFRKTADAPLKKIGMVISGKGDKPFILPLLNIVNAIKLKDAYTNHAMMRFMEDKHSWSPRHNVVYYLPANSAHGAVPDTEWAKGKIPGILRILGKDAHRHEDLTTKKHELFIKIPLNYVDTEDNRFDYKKYIKDNQRSLLPVPQQVWQRYHDLADERTKSQKNDKELKKDEDCSSSRWLPFHLKGTERKRDTKKNVCDLPLENADLVYFAEQSRSVTEIAFSAIWRSRVEDSRNQNNASTVHTFFPPDLLPFNPERKKISPVELLFGFVEDVKKEKEKPGKGDDENKALAFAGKVRISAGVLPKNAPDESSLLEEEITLKALSSPKPPSPALYFTPKNDADGYISKQDLSIHKHKPKGRKQYLHALRSKDDPAAVQQLDKQGHPADNGIRTYPWKSLHPKERQQLKVKVQPITPKTSFYFHLDFSNLTEWELGLLCFALRPSDEFRHKLGMGKPVGLGTVRIDLAGLHCIDRKKRYAEDGTEATRYNQGGWTDPDPMRRQELEQAGYSVPERSTAPDPKECREHFRKTMDPDILQALWLLGNPENVRSPVHYPQIKSDIHGNDSNIDIENENFSWFVDNDRKYHECLIPLDKDSDCLPPLTRRKEVER